PLHQKIILNALQEVLDNTHENTRTSAAAALNQVAEIIHQRSLVVIFSDMFESNSENEELFSALQHLKYRKHEVVLFHVTDKSKELDFEFDNKPYHFIDMESGEEIRLNAAQLKEQYQKAVSAFTEELNSQCQQFKIVFVEADINGGFD